MEIKGHPFGDLVDKEKSQKLLLEELLDVHKSNTLKCVTYPVESGMSPLKCEGQREDWRLCS